MSDSKVNHGSVAYSSTVLRSEDTEYGIVSFRINKTRLASIHLDLRCDPSWCVESESTTSPESINGWQNPKFRFKTRESAIAFVEETLGIEKGVLVASSVVTPTTGDNVV